MSEQPKVSQDRWSFSRDVLVFQFKLLADGFRDMVLIPASLVAGLAGLLFNRDNPSEPYYKVLALGKRSEYWINLFGGLPEEQQLEASTFVSRSGNLDQVVDRLENILRGQYEKGSIAAGLNQVVDKVDNMLREQYEKGGITASEKTSIDESIDALHRGIDSIGTTVKEDEGQ
jgi:hypothetical protein